MLSLFFLEMRTQARYVDTATATQSDVREATQTMSWMRRIAIMIMSTTTGMSAQSLDFRHGDLKVSANHRFLMHADGTPFFYLGDTAWELFHRLTIEESAAYLDNRSRKGFTVIQAVILAELDGLNTPNAEGQRPLIGNDPARVNEAYFRHVDKVIHLARERGLYIGVLPTWGDKVVKAWGVGPVIFTPEKARVYGRILGQRYKDRPNIIWILGGDRDPAGVEQVWREMAAGLKEGDGGRHLITFHPQGGQSSGDRLQAEPWLDFNMLQSGHARKDLANYRMIETDYQRVPVKPCTDGEPRYENHPVNWKPEQNGWFDDFDVRQAAYWAVFAGAQGHTYGCHDIWQMKTPGREAVGLARGDWHTSLDLPGAGEMQHVRRLMLSRPYFSRVPDQTLIEDAQQDGPGHLQATRGDGYAFLYTPLGASIHVALGKISGATVKAWWYDTRTGTASAIGEFANRGTRTFTPPGTPSCGNDWVLVLDDAARGFGAPGGVDAVRQDPGNE